MICKGTGHPPLEILGPVALILTEYQMANGWLDTTLTDPLVKNGFLAACPECQSTVKFKRCTPWPDVGRLTDWEILGHSRPEVLADSDWIADV